MKRNRTEITRRGFLSGAIAALASAATLSGASSKLFGAAAAQSRLGQPEGKTANDAIIMRELGATGIELPVVNMGVMNADMPGLVRAAYDHGMRHFDTAANYQFGRNETMVGSVIRELGARKNVIISTKVHIPQQRRGLAPEESKRKLLEAFEGSLRRLATDYVDILYLHSVSTADDMNEPGAREALAELKKAGKARCIGVSTHSNMADVLHEAARGGFYDVVLTSYNFTLGDDTKLEEAIREAAGKGIGIIAMKTLAGGDRWPNEDTRTEYTRATITSACMKWVLQNKHIGTVIPGFTTYEQLRDDAAVARRIALTEDEKRFLSDNRVKLGMGFCRQCGVCLASCPGGADVPSLVRAHMYAAQYGNLLAARSALAAAEPGRGIEACRSCGTCGARCAHAVDIPRRIEELRSFYC
jgi:predicted aldo/keto reductase-like oxidoreductase